METDVDHPRVLLSDELQIRLASITVLLLDLSESVGMYFYSSTWGRTLKLTRVFGNMTGVRMCKQIDESS